MANLPSSLFRQFAPCEACPVEEALQGRSVILKRDVGRAMLSLIKTVQEDIVWKNDVTTEDRAIQVLQRHELGDDNIIEPTLMAQCVTSQLSKAQEVTIQTKEQYL